MSSQKLVSALACLLIVVLVAILAFVWLEFHKGAFASPRVYAPLDDNSISFAISSPGASGPATKTKDWRDQSYIENLGLDVEIVKPRKLGPQPLHAHDVVFDEMNNFRGGPKVDHNSGHFRHHQAETWDPNPRYEIAAFGRKMLLNLYHDDKFISPYLHIQRIWSNYSHRVPHDSRMSGCFYSGNIQGDKESDVVVSLCHGMTGYIRTSEGMYYIEPAENFRDGNLGTLLHRIKKVPHPAEVSSNEVTSGESNTCVTHGETEDSGKVTPERKYAFPKRSLLSTSPREKRETQYLDTEEYDEGKNVKYYIKVMIVADRSMVEFFKNRETLNHYILTLMSQTYRLYKDSSIGNPIYVSVTAIKILEHVDFDSQSSSGKTLEKFCQWSRKNGITTHSDVAVLLTRNSVCMDCATIGLAKMGSICTETSCAVVVDKGLSTTYVIAHELGHVLSLKHDSDHRCASYNKGVEQKYIMVDSFVVDIKPWIWSPCSRHYLTEVLRSKKTKCLLRPPNQDYIDRIATMPGKMYNLDQQCELEFDVGYVHCKDYQDSPCGSLWCRHNTSADGSCTKQLLVAEGTYCGTGRWCQYGECIPLNENDLTPINGGWGKWSEWGECSKTCGGGIKISQRECNNPIPENGGDYCLGSNIRYASCNTQTCPDSIDFRAVQCSKFNGNPNGVPNLSRDVIWLPKYGLEQENACKLYCRPKHSQNYHLLKNKVVDGTKCDLKSFGICVNGICKPGGCDNRLGSKVVLDDCGVCGGDNSGCEEISGSYNVTGNGYHRVLKLPKGSSKLDIKQRDISEEKHLRNYLALKDPETKEYILNGINKIFEQPADIVFSNSIVKYSGSDGIVERIYTEKNERLNKDLILEILSIDMTPPDVTYKYVISKADAPRYGWMLYQKQWSKCSSICEGIQTMRPSCVDLGTIEPVNDYYCANQDLPANLQKKDCNVDCRLKWKAIAKGDCSTNCGEGIRSVTSVCVKEDKEWDKYVYFKSLGSEGAIVDDYHCHRSLGKPNHTETCQGTCSEARWDYGIWSECSQSCGGGVQKRTAICVNSRNDVVADENCRHEEKVVLQVCKNIKCPVWVASDWTKCSQECGTGHKTRVVVCRIDGRVYKDHNCDKSTKPAERNECFERPCVLWDAEPWGSCSVSCGGGVQTREIVCRTVDGRKIMDSERCSGLARPNATRSCHLRRCLNTVFNYNSTWYSYKNEVDVNDNSVQIEYKPVYRWHTGSWSQCSKSCGGGIQSRMVLCHNDRGDQNDAMCQNLPKPVATINCNAFLCPKWVSGSWSSCDDKCEKKRSVACQNITGSTMAEDSCNPKTRPSDVDKCPLSQCPHALNSLSSYYFNSSEDRGRRYRWSAGKWKPCSSRCGKGTRYRNVTCTDSLNDVVLVDQFCRGAKKPKTSKPCERYSCSFAWIEGHWSPCSASCGTGVKRRNVTCHVVYPDALIDPKPLPDIRYNRNSKRFFCDIYTKPRETAACRESNCGDVFVWKAGPWKRCSHRCGKKGRQVRQLSCVHARTGQKAGKRLCPRNLRPKRKQKCNQWRCAHRSCKDVKSSLNTKVNKDYLLTINGKRAVVYCFKMDTSEPEEYISLQSDTQNYAEYYDKRLKHLDSCPSNGQRIENCDCIEVDPKRAGFTRFYKVRLNITTMRIVGEDYTFVEQIKGTKVPYGTAGDCYSKAGGCEQGRFSIDLTGTSFRLSGSVRWTEVGSFVTSQIRTRDRSVTGKCGGFCGYCVPDIGVGLQVEVT